MLNYNERMIKAKEKLDQRLKAKGRTRKDGEEFAIEYFASQYDKMVERILDSFIHDIEDEDFSETYFENTFSIQNDEYFNQSDAYRSGFKEKIVALVSEKICELIPDFKNNYDVKIKEMDLGDSRIIKVIVSLQF